MLENAMKLYPNGGFLQKHEMISLITPMAGKIMMYTAGCE